MYIIRTRDLDLDCTQTWQRSKGPKYLANSFQPFVTVNSVYPTLGGASRQANVLKRNPRYSFCKITVEKLDSYN